MGTESSMLNKIWRTIRGRSPTAAGSLDQLLSLHPEVRTALDDSLLSHRASADSKRTLDASGSRRHWVENIECFAPHLLPTFMTSASHTLKLMGDNDPQTRAHAVTAGYAIWRLENDPQFIQNCCDMLIHDAYMQPRISAFYVLSLSLLRSPNRLIMRALATVVKEPRAPIELRNDAYGAILSRLSDNPADLGPITYLKVGELLEVDSDMIERILNDPD